MMKRSFAAWVTAAVLLLTLSSSQLAAAPLAGTLSGRVTNAGGSGINGVQIVVNFGATFYSANTDSSGNYTVGNVTAGAYNVVAAPSAGSGYANAHRYGVQVGSGTTTQNFTLVSNPATLTGYVYDAGTGARIAGVGLLLDSDVHDGWSNTLQSTGSNGVYSMDRIAPGRIYYIHAFPPAGSNYGNPFFPVTINAGSNTFNVPLGQSGSHIAGRVTLPGGAPAVNASIFINPSGGSSGSDTCPTATNSNGDYTCSLSAGGYDVHLGEFQSGATSYPGLVYFNRQLGSGTLTVNFSLNNGPLTISGLARDYTLTAINGANVQAFEQADPGHYRSTFVGSDGRYNFTGMGSTNSYYFQAAAQGYATNVSSFAAIPSNPWTRNFKLGVFNDVLAQDADSRIEFPFYYVEFMRDRNIIAGFTDPSQCPSNKAPCFLPNNNVRRGEYSKMLVLAKGWPTNAAGGPHFTDVPTSNIFYNTIETAYNNGAISGYTAAQCGGDVCFRPNGTITRAEATKLAVAASSWTLLNPATASYADVPASYWAYRYIETARANGANANDDPSFRPGSFITRGETAKLVCVANANGCGQ